MKLFRISFFLAFFLVLVTSFPKISNAQNLYSSLNKSNIGLSLDTLRVEINPYFAKMIGTHYCNSNNNQNLVIVETPIDGGIIEIIPEKYRVKYQSWKSEFLSTEAGRQQWESYAQNKNFKMVITVSSKEGQGAGTGDYLWNEAGDLVGATITLGKNLDKGLPNPIYFPVMSALSSEESSYTVSGNILAATKFAHEIGHVNQTARTKSETFQLQNKLIPLYNEILLKNGYNIKDQKLIELAGQMGGTPVEIWENREYWGEFNAMLYLTDRINRESYNCSVFNKMKRNIKLYAKDYEDRFTQISDVKKLNQICDK